jgi:hypothetical protein
MTGSWLEKARNATGMPLERCLACEADSVGTEERCYANEAPRLEVCGAHPTPKDFAYFVKPLRGFRPNGLASEAALHRLHYCIARHYLLSYRFSTNHEACTG